MPSNSASPPTTDRRPFHKAYTRIEKTAKRAISLAEIRRIKALDLAALPTLDLACDIFLFLFYCRGMSFIDAAYLTHSDIVGDEIVYCRHKTGQEIRVGLNAHIRRLLDKWHSRPASGHPLLPILSGHSDSNIARNEYETATISDALGHDSEMTTQIYLASLSTKAIDRANSLILRDL